MTDIARLKKARYPITQRTELGLGHCDDWEVDEMPTEYEMMGWLRGQDRGLLLGCLEDWVRNGGSLSDMLIDTIESLRVKQKVALARLKEQKKPRKRKKKVCSMCNGRKSIEMEGGGEGFLACLCQIPKKNGGWK